VWAVPTSPRKGLSALPGREAEIELRTWAGLNSPGKTTPRPAPGPSPTGVERPQSHFPPKLLSLQLPPARPDEPATSSPPRLDAPSAARELDQRRVRRLHTWTRRRRPPPPGRARGRAPPGRARGGSDRVVCAPDLASPELLRLDAHGDERRLDTHGDEAAPGSSVPRTSHRRSCLAGAPSPEL
jgi:hypothetical protein